MSARHALTSIFRRKALVAAVAACIAGYAQANPTNPTVVSGAATFAASGKSLNVTNTPGAVINWQGFSVKADELTRFIQQNAQSAVLNRVTGQEHSAILGQLLSNGRVYLINPNGITIGAGARIDTAGFVASSLSLSDSDALAGKFKLRDTGSSGKVINNGTITTATGGFVYLVAPDVENNGVITSPKGEIILAAGKSVELVDSQKPELRVELTAPENTAINVGKMIAEAGSIGIFAGAIRQKGLISANSAVVGENGKIFLKAKKNITLDAGSKTEASGPQGGSITIESEAGSAAVAGIVEAIGTQGRGGTISVTAPVAVTIEPTARVSADGSEGGSVTLTSAAGPVTIAAPVTANATVGRAGQVAVSAASKAALASTGQLSASGGQGGGAVSVKGSGGVTLDLGSVMQASGAAGGSVAVQADQGAVEARGTLDVTGNEGAGGSVQIAARSDITLDVASRILASGRSAGEVRIESGEGTLLASGLIDGQGKDGPGGRVWMLAPRVGLIREAVVNVSGRTGGGVALVGGDYQGKNPEVQNAERTYVGRDVSIKADALDSGDGGKVIVWANDWTKFYGTITARGGPRSGNGGFVETSGKNNLIILGGSVDASATSGAAGIWLLDPSNVNIIAATAEIDTLVNTPTAGTTTFSPTDPATAATIDVATINTALNAGTNVIVDTVSSAAQTGTITVTSAVLKTAGGDATLTLDAADTITVSNTIGSTTGGRLGVTLKAGSTVTINNAITTNGGDFQSTGTTFTNAAGGTIATAGGALTIDHTGFITISDTLSSSGGNISITGSDLTLSGPTVDSGSGNVTLKPKTASSIGVGAFVGVFSVSDPELTYINSTGTITIGDRTLASFMTVEGVGADASNRTKNLRLATAGTINENAAATAVTLTTGTLTLDAASTIGNTSTFNVNVAKLAVRTEASFIITNAGTLTDLSVTTNGAAATQSLASTGLTYTVAEAGSNTTIDAITSTGALNFSYQNTVGNITVASSGIATNGGDISLVSAGVLGLNANVTTTGTGTVSLTSDSDGDNTGSFAQTAGTISTNNGAISITNGDADSGTGNVLLGLITDTGGAGITVKSQAGSILENVGGSSLLTSAGTISLLAGNTTKGATSVGDSTNAINTNGGTLTATSGTGGIYIDESNGATVSTVTVTGATGDIKIQNAAGTLSTTGVISTQGGNITLQATTGAIALNNSVSTSGGSATLTAGTTINSNASGMINTTGSAGNPGAAGGEVLLHSTGAGDITLNALITASGGNSTGISGGGAGGVVTILNDNGAINVHNITTRGGAAGGGGAAGTDGTIQLSATTTIGQQASTSLQAGNLKLRTTGGAGGAVSLTNTGNDVGTLAANLTAGSSLSYVDANSVTIGTVNAAGTGAANLGSVAGITAAGNVTLTALGAGDLMVSNDIVKTGGGNQTVTLKANQNIIFNNGADVNGAGTGGTYTVVLNSDLDASGAGAIQLNDGTVLNSNGGSITLGGGSAGTGASNAVGIAGFVEGVKLDGAQLVSGAGAIVIRGTGLGGTTNAHGVSLTTASSTVSSITSTSGPITLTGAGGAGTGGDRGIYLTAGSSIASGSGLITLTGTGNGTGTSNHGIELVGSSITSTGTTAIQMTGTSATGSNDVLVSGASTIGGGTASGDILLNGTTSGGTVLGTGTVTLQTTGNVTINQTGGGLEQTGGSILASGLRLLGVGAFNLNQTANNVNVLVADLTGAATSLSYRDTNGFSIGSAGPGGLTTAKTAGSGTTTTNGITVGAAATAANTLTLNAYGAVTQTTSDNVIAGGLQLLGNGPYSLSNAGNDVTTFAANVAGNISYRDTGAFTVGIVTDAPSSVSSTGITTTGLGTLTLDNGSVMTIAQNISADGAISQISSAGTGSVSITNPRSISTTSDAVSFASPVTLNGAGTNTSIDTRVGGGAGGDITFQGTLNAATAAPNAETLTLNAGTGGNILFTGAVGGVSRLGAINITNANNVTESAGITAASLTQAAGQGTTTFAGAVNTDTATGVNLTGNAQTVNAGITTTGNGIVTFSNAGLLTLNADIGADGAVTQNGAGVVTINTDRTITTTADSVGFATNVTLAKTGGTGMLTINTTSGNAAGANITFSSKLDGTTAVAEPLTLNAGTAGNILFTGAVGSGSRLGAINITNANNVTESAGITAASLVQAAGQGTTTFNGAVNTNTVTGVNLTGNVQTVNAGISTTGNGGVTFSNAGLLTLNGDIVSDGAVTQNGAGAVTITAPGSITTTSDAVNFLRAVTLNGGVSGLVSIDTRVGGGAGGDITFQSTLNATAGAPSAETLTLDAGTGGSILFSGAVGGVSRLGAINITNANNVTESAGITAASLTQAAGQGTTTFNGAVNTNTATGVNLTGNVQTVNAGISTTGNGGVTFSNAGLLTLNGDIVSDGAVTQNGAGAVTITAPGSITTTSDAVNFLRAVTLNGGVSGLVSIDTRVGGGAGGDITFQSTLDATTAAPSAETLTLDAGTGGSILFSGAVGGVSRLGAINITNANNVTESAGITAASLTQAAGQGTTTFNGAVNTNTATGVNLTGNVQTVNAGISTTGNGGVSFSNAGVLTLNGDIVSDGAVTQNGAATVTITAPGSITTTSDAINFLRAVTLNGGASSLVSMDTRVGGGAGGDITFQSTLNATAAAPSAETLTLDAGTAGNILFTGAVGGLSRLGAINITNANNVTESAGITAASLTQAAGQGTTTFNGAVNTNTATGVNLTGNVQTVNAGISTTGNGVVTFSNAGLLTLNADISADGAVTQNGAGVVTINTDRAITTTADAIGFAASVTLNKTGGSGLLTINTASGNPAGANITFSNTLTGTTDSAENLTLTAGSGGAVTFNGAVGAIRLGDVNITQARDLTIQSGFAARTLIQSLGAAGAPSTTPSAGTTTINGAVDTTGNTSIATSGALHVSGTGSIAAGAGSTVTLTTGGDMTLSGSVTAPAGATLNVIGTDRVLTQNGGTLGTTNSAIALIADEMVLTSAIDSGSGAVTLKPNSPTDAIQLGVAAASTNDSAATLELSDSELNTITTTGGLTIGASNNTGAITVVGALTPTTAQNGLALLNRVGGIAINAPFTYAAGNGNLTLTANGGGAAVGAITTSGSALDVSGILAMNAATGVGTLASPMVLAHAAGTTLIVTNSTSGGVFVRADSGDLSIDSINNLAATGAGINLNVGANLNINGTVESTVGDIQFVTGNDTAYTGAGGFGLSPAAVAAGTLGGVNINGRVIANNGGAISIFSTGAVKQSTVVAAGLQSIPVEGTVEQGALRVRTFNNGTQVGVIDLQNNLAGSGNSMGPITLEARLAGSLNPPPYAESNIDYKSINGTSISGIGTAADFSLVAPSQTIDLAPGASLSGSNISLIATAGDVTVKSAITNAQVNGGQSGGSLNLYATGNIVLNNPGGDSAGVVIGKDLGTLDEFGEREFEKFDHTLRLVATGDIRIHGTVQVTGDLALRANAGASEASGPGGVAGFGAGSGSVIIAGSAGNPVEVRARNIVVGVKDASGNPLPVRDLIIDNSANVADSGQFFDTTLRADSKLDIYLNGDQGGAGTSGNIVITGGNAAAVSAGIVGTATKSSALAVIRGEVVSILGVKGGTQLAPNLNMQTWNTQDPDTPLPDAQTVNPLLPYTTNSSSITLQGGIATSNTAAGGGALAAADALILGTSGKFIDIGGNIVFMGGTADSNDGGQTSAAAKIDPVNLRINTGGYIKLVGGEGGGARAALVNSGDMEINIGGKFDYTYTDASGTHTVKDVGLLLAGGLGSGLYDRDNQPITLYYDVSSQVLLLFPAVNGGAGGGSYFLHEDLTKASAFVQSLSPRGFDDSLMAYIIFAANEETRTGRIRTAISNEDDANKPSCN